MTNAEPVRRTDQILGADLEFAHSPAIIQRNLARFRIGMEMLATRHPNKAHLLSRVATLDDTQILPLFFDPVLRNAFEDGLAALENGVGPNGCYSYFLENLTIDGLDGMGPCELLSRPHLRPWPAMGPGWVWNELADHVAVDSAFRNRLEEMFRGTVAERTSVEPIPATDDMFAALCQGAELLCELMPVSGAGVLRHIALIGFIEYELPGERMYSFSGGDPLPSAIFMAPERLVNPWSTAEILLHEGLHLKLFDVLRTGSIVAAPQRLVAIPWRNTQWTLVRVLSALHVYIHLLLFDAAAASGDLSNRHGVHHRSEEIDAPSPGSPAAVNRTYLTVLDRARYLAEQAESIHAADLTVRGRAFVSWLLDAIEAVVPDLREGWVKPFVAESAPPAPGRNGRYTRAESVLNTPLPELGQLLAVSRMDSRMKWLNSRAWLIYSLCDGADLSTIEAGYRARLVEAGADLRTETASDVRLALHQLVDEGLVVCVDVEAHAGPT